MMIGVQHLQGILIGEALLRADLIGAVQAVDQVNRTTVGRK